VAFLGLTLSNADARCNDLENLVNKHRRQNGLSTLECHDKPRYMATIHTYDLKDADYNCGDLHAWRSEKWTPGVGTCGSGNEYNCKMMALHQGKDFVLQTRHLGYAEISAESKYKVVLFNLCRSALLLGLFISPLWSSLVLFPYLSDGNLTFADKLQFAIILMLTSFDFFSDFFSRWW